MKNCDLSSSKIILKKSQDPQKLLKKSLVECTPCAAAVFDYGMSPNDTDFFCRGRMVFGLYGELVPNAVRNFEHICRGDHGQSRATEIAFQRSANGLPINNFVSLSWLVADVMNRDCVLFFTIPTAEYTCI